MGGRLLAEKRKWIAAGCFEATVHDLLRKLLRLNSGHEPDPTAAVFLASRTLRSTPESGHRGGYNGTKSKKGSKIYVVVLRDIVPDLPRTNYLYTERLSRVIIQP